MTTVDLVRLARTVIPPVGATMAIAVVEHESGGKLANGAPSGLGGRTWHGAAWLIDGRTRTAPIALFDRPRDALALVRILNGEAPRGPLAPTTPVDERRAVPDPAGPGAPGPVPGVPSTAGDVCAGCGDPIPPGRHGQRRRTCSVACRQRARGRRGSNARQADTGGGVTPSIAPRASVADAFDSTDPVSLEEAGGGSSARPPLRRPPNPAAAPMPGQRGDVQLPLLSG